MIPLLWLWFGLSGCAGRPPLAPAWWLEVEPGLHLCVSGVPSASALPRRSRDAYSRAAANLARGQLSAASAGLTPLPPHPAVESALGVAEVLAGEAQRAVDRYDALLAEHPDDPCLLATRAVVGAAVSEPSGVESLIRARQLAPDDPQIAFLAWYLEVEHGGVFREALEAGWAQRPAHAGFAMAVGVERYRAGDRLGAVEPLTAALESGMTSAGDILVHVYWELEQRDAYLRTASALGLPLGDGGSIARAADPEEAYRQTIGWTGADPPVAVITTGEGVLTCTLMPQVAPVTVANFVWLSEQGTYDGLTFHRVIPAFMVQGGDPTGTGEGGPGYQFLDEIDPSVGFDAPGVLAMANAGRDTNGSQFFVTEVATPHLSGLHTVFGQCDAISVDVVRRIAERGPGVVIDKVELRGR